MTKLKILTKRQRKAEKADVLERLCTGRLRDILARLMVLRMTTSLDVGLLQDARERAQELHDHRQLGLLNKIHTAVMTEYPEGKQQWVSVWEWKAALHAALSSPRAPDIYKFITDDQLDAVSHATKHYAAQAQNSRPPRKLSPTGRAVH